MAAAEYYSGACIECVPKYLLAPNILQQAQTEQIRERTNDVEIVQGRILWLPAMEDLPEHAVRRAHGKGAIEEGIYNHPVVVISRPLEDEQVVHFHLITSLQGKKLDQLYPKSNEFHTSRRSWYLPISPSPDHPDAISKKAKKRFPTLALAGNATLRWDSYVNIRHVYKIDWTLLKPYTNLSTPKTALFRLEQESTVRMIAKGKILTLYEPGEQLPTPGLDTARTAPQGCSIELSSGVKRGVNGLNSSDYKAESIASPVASRTQYIDGPDSQTLNGDGSRSMDARQNKHPDCIVKRTFFGQFYHRLFHRSRKS